ncbi:MAG: hypothetical protein VX252_10245 [Myxococcota bacterium]|nr:hypothetical protein [Myxococcota bacterium]
MNRLYDALPVPVQNLACTWEGYRRGRARYTKHFHRTLKKWNESLHSPLEALHEYQRTRLNELIETARTSVPYYRDLAPASDAKDPLQSIQETLGSITPLEKMTYRNSANQFISNRIPRSRLHQNFTGGTTGTALPIFYTPESLAEEYATVWRLRMEQHCRILDSNLTFNGQSVVPFSQSEAPFWRHNAYGRQTLFSVYHMTPRNLHRYIDAINKSRAKYVQGYPSALHLVGRAMIEAGKTLPKGSLKAVFTSSESLLAFQRETIEEAFGTRVWDRYGSGEFSVSMTECQLGNLHVDMEFCIVEVQIEEETETYERGSFMVTGLSNSATPLLRYRIGDSGTRLKKPCPCGRAGDVFLDVDGRNEDFIMTPDGRLVGRLDHIFKKQIDILEAQIRQDSKEAVEILVVPDHEYNKQSEIKITKEVRRRLGEEIHIDIRLVNSIPRERNGKFRAVKSTIGRLEG